MLDSGQLSQKVLEACTVLRVITFIDGECLHG